MKKRISEKVINKIKKEHIIPESKWKLSWKNYVFWILLAILILLGALFFSLIILNLSDIDRDLYLHFKLRNFIWFVMRTAPFLWIILSVLTLVFGLLAFQKTRHGYRYQTLFVASLIVLAILILGVMTHFLKINNRFENFSRGIPRYKNLAHPKEFRWLKPEEGLLAGEIIKLKSNGVVIINFKGEEWSVDYGNETIIDPRVELAEKEQIRIIGEKIGNFCFKAQIIKKMNRTIMHSPQKFR